MRTQASPALERHTPHLKVGLSGMVILNPLHAERLSSCFVGAVCGILHRLFSKTFGLQLPSTSQLSMGMDDDFRELFKKLL